MKKLVVTLTLMLVALLPAAAWAGDYNFGYSHGSSRGHSYGGNYSYSRGGSHRYGFNYGGRSYSSGMNYSRGSRSYSYGGHSTSYSRSYNRGATYSHGQNYSHTYTHNYSHSKPVQTSSSYSAPERRYHYRTGYRDGGTPFAFNFYRKGYDSNNGYTGSYGNDNRQHRGDYEAYMKRINYEARNGTYMGDGNDIEPAAGPTAPRASTGSVCGNWERGNEACRVQGTTRRWEPWMVVYNR